MNVPTVTSPVNPSVRNQTQSLSAVSPPITPKPVPNDDELVEYLISHSYHQMMTAVDDAGRRYWCDRLTSWVKQRSPGRVHQMEREKGLA